MVLVNNIAQGMSVDRCRGRKHQSVYSMIAHDLEQIERAAHVVGVDRVCAASELAVALDAKRRIVEGE